MKHIKYFENINNAIGNKVENPCVSKIGDDIYYSNLEGVIASVSNNVLDIVNEIEYWKSQPLTITNIGDTEGIVSIIGRNPNGYNHKTLSTGGIGLYKNGYLVSVSDNSWISYHNYNDYTIVEATILPGESILVKALTTLTICNQNYYGTSDGPYLNFNLTHSKFKASGNMLSINKYLFSDIDSLQHGLFYKLFYNCTNLIDIKDLYCPIVGDCCYRETFFNTGVDTLPIFDGLDIYKYSLQWAFKYCYNLIDLSDYTLIDLEYALSGEGDCYGMFENCVNLEKSPVINDNYPEHAQYKDMFNGCYSLKEITYKGLIDSSLPSLCSAWVNGVNNSGIMYINSIWYSNLVDLGCGTSTYPCGWEVKTI